MKPRKFLRRMGWFFLILLVIVAYLVIYFFPAVIDINRSKREIKDKLLRIGDLSRIVETIRLADIRERNIFKQSHRTFWEKFPKLYTQSARSHYYQNVVEHIKKSASRLGIRDLMIMSDEKDPEVLSQMSCPGRKPPIAQLKHFLQSSPETSESRFESMDFYEDFLENVSSRVLILCFCGETKNVARLINRLPHFPSYMNEEQVLIVAGKPLPYILLKLRVYYRDKTKIRYRSKHSGKKNNYIDFNSPLLLQPVYLNTARPAGLHELSGEWGNAIFSKSSGSD